MNDTHCGDLQDNLKQWVSFVSLWAYSVGILLALTILDPRVVLATECLRARSRDAKLDYFVNPSTRV